MLDKRALDFYPCLQRGYNKPLISCLACKKYPCKGFESWRDAILETSPFVEYSPESKLIRRRSNTMYLFKYNDGTIREAYRNFDPNKPDFHQLEGVSEVLVISKILVKQVKLVARPAEERTKILASEPAVVINQDDKKEAPAGKRRRKG